MQISQLNLHSAPEGIAGLLKERGFDTIFKKEREQRNSRISYRFSALLRQVSGSHYREKSGRIGNTDEVIRGKAKRVTLLFVHLN